MARAVKKKQAHVWERGEHDWYVEDSRASAALFRVEEFDGAVWDPSCGRGNIVYSALAAGYEAVGTDIVCRFPVEPVWFCGELNFLTDDLVISAPNIVMNPPFYRAAGAEAFIRKALSVCARKVCVFVDVKFLAGADRAKGLFAQFPPTRIWIIHPRVSCPPGEYLEAGGKAAGGTADWCWIVWDREDRSGRTELKWLNVKGD